MQADQVPNTERIGQMLDRIGAEAVFGEPTVQGDVTIVPVARVSFGFGYGGGYGQGPEGDGEEAEQQSAEGGGGGVGGGGRIRPQGFIRITPDGVTFEPVSDPSRVALAGVAMAAWSVFWIAWALVAIARAIAGRRQS